MRILKKKIAAVVKKKIDLENDVIVRLFVK